MLFPRAFFPLLFAFILASCDTSTSDPKPQAAQHSTATVQLYPSPLFPRSDRFVANQTALLTSGPLIQIAAKNCDLDPKTLSSSLVIEQIPNTDLLTITAYHDDQNQTKVIVQTLLATYRDHRKKIELAATAEELKALDKELISQSEKVDQLRQDLGSFPIGIPHTDNNPSSPIHLNEKQIFQSAREKLADFETQRDQIEIPNKKLAETPTEELIPYAAGLDLPDNQVAFHFEQHRKAIEDKDKLLANGFGKKHPAIIAAQKKAEKSMQEAKKETVSLKEVLTIKRELLDRQIKRMREMINKPVKEANDLNSRHLKYKFAKEAYEDARKALQNIQANQQNERSKLSKPLHLLAIHGWEHE